MKYNCEVIKDLIPLYHDEICSDQSKAVVEEHFDECEDCKAFYNELCQTDAMDELYDDEKQKQAAESFKKAEKKRKRGSRVFMYIGIVIGCMVAGLVARFISPIGIAMGLLFSSALTAKVEEFDDVSAYDDMMTSTGDFDEFGTMWGMRDCGIWPETITDEMNVQDFHMTYYNPWDAQYLGYMAVEYDAEAYEEEMARLNEIGCTDYIGYYSVTGFSEYDLVAMYADEYNGFVYALTDGDDTIIYVDIIFCNWFMDLDYEKYMPAEYFPDGFDATENNPYQLEMMKQH